MLFLPYRFDLHLNRLPWLTVIVVLVCVAVYWQQYFNELDVVDGTTRFCAGDVSTIERIALDKAAGASDPAACEEFMYRLVSVADPSREIASISAEAEPMAGLDEMASRSYIDRSLTGLYARYQRTVPQFRTGELWYAPESWDPVTMVTSTFAHGDWLHLLGNVVFFFAFAAAVEVIIGPVAFFAVIMALAFGTNIAYSLAMMGVDSPLPTVGLSGVVMGMIALLAFLLPTARIRCFYWMILWFGTIAVPAWVLALAYIGIDVFTLWTTDDLGGINLVAHLSGAALGFVLAVAFFRRARADVRAQQLAQHRARAI